MLSVILTRKEMAATFECRIETEALEATVRYQLKVDLQGKPNTIVFLIIYIAHKWKMCSIFKFFYTVLWSSPPAANLVVYHIELFKLYKQIEKCEYKEKKKKTYDSLYWSITVRPRKVEVSGVRTHTVQGSTVSLLCRVMCIWN